MISPPLIRISEPGAHWLLSSSKKRLQRRNIVFILTPVRYAPALLVDISEFGLNSKIAKSRNSAVLSFAERAILPLRGRIAFCLPSAPVHHAPAFLTYRKRLKIARINKSSVLLYKQKSVDSSSTLNMQIVECSGQKIPTAHTIQCLLLLPSGPDKVHTLALHEFHPSSHSTCLLYSIQAQKARAILGNSKNFL